jgi:hypothetical protein
MGETTRGLLAPDILEATGYLGVVSLDVGSTRSWSRWTLTIEDSVKLRAQLEAAERKALQR